MLLPGINEKTGGIDYTTISVYIQVIQTFCLPAVYKAQHRCVTHLYLQNKAQQQYKQVFNWLSIYLPILVVAAGEKKSNLGSKKGDDIFHGLLIDCLKITVIAVNVFKSCIEETKLSPLLTIDLLHLIEVACKHISNTTIKGELHVCEQQAGNSINTALFG